MGKTEEYTLLGAIIDDPSIHDLQSLMNLKFGWNISDLIKSLKQLEQDRTVSFFVDGAGGAFIDKHSSEIPFYDEEAIKWIFASKAQYTVERYNTLWPQVGLQSDNSTKR